ncbi:MAG: hypothetical protein WCL04_07995 [Verrucomicrobiota bacterium]
MQDPFTGKDTCLCGSRLPGPQERADLLDGHWQRLWALDQLVAAAGQCGIRSDQDRDFALLPEDEVSLLEGAGGVWTALGDALREFRRRLPFVSLETFGFQADGEDIFEANTRQLAREGGGVEALAFAGVDRSIYKFYFFREGGAIGSGFAYTRDEDGKITATSVPGTYRLLLAKLLLIHQLGMATEVLGLTREGILVAKQALGKPLPQGDDTSRALPAALIEIPSRFLRADRDHPRLFFFGAPGQTAQPWLVADLHARNFVRGADGALHVIDLVAAPWPDPPGGPLIAGWLARVRENPSAGLLGASADEEL